MMLYEDMHIHESLNFVLADAFEASGQQDVLEWLGSGKTIAEMRGDRFSDAFYTAKRREEIRQFVHVFGWRDLQHYLNNSDDVSAIVLMTNLAGLLVFTAGDPAGQPAITTDWFARQREAYFSRVP